MQNRHSYKHPHPAVAVDLAIFTLRDGALQLLLVKRGREPHKGSWALPGGFVRIDEDLVTAAQRELQEETGVDSAYLEQVGAFGTVDRDPRERVISVAYFAILASDSDKVRAGSDADEAQWWAAESLPKLAFDHPEIVAAARRALVEKVRRTTIALQFLPPEFALSDLQSVHEAVLGQEIDKRNFRKWIDSLDYLVATGRQRRGGQHRPAALFRGRPDTVIPVAAADISSAPRKSEAAIAAAYRRGYEDSARELQSAVADAHRSLMKRIPKK